MSKRINPNDLPELMSRQSESAGSSRKPEIRGRRATDGSARKKNSRKVNLAILASFLFSGGLTAWSFSRPFIAGGLSSEGRQRALEGNQVNHRWEAQLTNEQYVDYALDTDRELIDRVYRKYNDYQRAPTPHQVKQRWERSMRRKREMVKRMIEQNGGEPFLKGTAEWEFLRQLEAVAEDGPDTEE